jgi:hypothetical protein
MRNKDHIINEEKQSISSIIEWYESADEGQGEVDKREQKDISTLA